MSDPHDQSSQPSDGTPLTRSSVQIGHAATTQTRFWRVNAVAGEEHLLEGLVETAIKADIRLREHITSEAPDG